MIEDTNEEVKQLSAEPNVFNQELERRLDQMSSRLDRLEALQDDEQRHWESLVQELIKMRLSLRNLFKA